MARIRFLKIFALLLLIGLSSGACSPAKKVPPKVLASVDGRFEITVPAAWKEEKSLNDSADLQASYRPSEMYVVVLSEPKEDFDGLTLEGHSKITRESLVSGVKDPKTSPGVAMRIGDMPAFQYEIRGVVGHVNVVYLHTTAESPRFFHQILTWTIPSRFEKNKETLQKVAATFREVPAGAAP